ncbi:unnamed protein product [Prorocentrum cordatum]|uniref:Uncharacterized protein n=1 Tax=Prorocentrum cordatum TaxID=2364126 RepID=A0ABN9UZG1_9DINO|nr:unnamed protein product [Polarella glacialis]
MQEASTYLEDSNGCFATEVLKCLDPDERERLVGITFTHGSRVVSFRLLEETAERCVALREFIRRPAELNRFAHSACPSLHSWALGNCWVVAGSFLQAVV